MYDKKRLIVIHILVVFIQVIDSTYRKSRETSSWRDAQDRCNMFGGRLATIDNIGSFSAQMNSSEMTYMLDDTELWVGAKLRQGSWTWHDDDQRIFNDSIHFYENLGCYNQQYWLGGVQLNQPTPENCLQHCGWQSAVGLKKDYCMCEKDLQNITTTQDAICHIQCSGDVTTMCGGYFGVSVYRPANLTIRWAAGEPKVNKNCALLRQKSREELPELVSANCDMQTRVLCSFDDTLACGIRPTCLKASSKHEIWQNANSACSMTSLEHMHVRNANDLVKLAPGMYWIALRRKSDWYWENGQRVKTEEFFPFENGLNSSPNSVCAVVRKSRGKIALSARNCDDTKYYLCQYDFMQKREEGVVAKVRVSSKEDSKNSSGTTTIKPVSVSFGDSPEASTEANTFLGAKGLYVLLGFLSGMVCVLIIGLIVYTIYRCNRPDPSKHRRLGDRDHESTRDTHSVHYSSKDESLQITPPASDITYDTVYDLQGESPFRRSQRLIQMGSANSWRHANNARRGRSDAPDSLGSDYTWRGVVGGKLEVINTELRHQYPNQSEGLTVSEAQALARSNSTYRPADYVYRSESLPSANIQTRCDVHSENPHHITTIESLYTLPLDNRAHRIASSANRDKLSREPSFNRQNSNDGKTCSTNMGFLDSSLPRRAVSPMKSDSLPLMSGLPPEAFCLPDNYEHQYGQGRVNRQSHHEGTGKRESQGHEPSFLELRTARNSLSNEDNIYATVKKTFQKIKDDLAEEARKDKEAEDADSTNYIRLTNL